MVEAASTPGPPRPPARAGKLIVLIWTCSLLVLGGAVGNWAVARNRRLREEAIVRHRAWMDPGCTEEGRTVPESTPPPAVEPGEPASDWVSGRSSRR
ncbi:hypothetical protein OJF2_65510 [Aquisphaera giovannonii]|uniref:Uncharacterized protein n=1 Tax=Aquisphaera giovannonii TaxID=406548 RepID=A0A5B9WD13_9BACT|nr:hypothetical protein OJF2_65510 [Aquisphaera giovannonii]